MDVFLGPRAHSILASMVRACVWAIHFVSLYASVCVRKRCCDRACALSCAPCSSLDVLPVCGAVLCVPTCSLCAHTCVRACVSGRSSPVCLHLNPCAVLFSIVRMCVCMRALVCRWSVCAYSLMPTPPSPRVCVCDCRSTWLASLWRMSSASSFGLLRMALCRALWPRLWSYSCGCCPPRPTSRPTPSGHTSRMCVCVLPARIASLPPSPTPLPCHSRSVPFFFCMCACGC